MFKDARLYTDKYKNGLLLSDIGAFLASDTTIDLVPDINIGTAKVIGRDGLIPCSRTLRSRKINLSIHFSPEDVAPLSPFAQHTLDELDELLSSIMYNHGKAIEIEFTEMPGRYYIGFFDQSKAPRFHLLDGDVGYTITCIDPYVYSVPFKGRVKSGSTLYEFPLESETVFPKFQLLSTPSADVITIKHKRDLNGTSVIYTAKLTLPVFVGRLDLLIDGETGTITRMDTGKFLPGCILEPTGSAKTVYEVMASETGYNQFEVTTGATEAWATLRGRSLV